MQKISPLYSHFPCSNLLIFMFLLLLTSCVRSAFPALNPDKGGKESKVVRLGIHYEYPFGGMATRPEWMPKGEADWRRDLSKIKETGLCSCTGAIPVY